MNKTTTEDLIKMQDITRMTGTLNQVQMYHLKMWAHVILGCNKMEAEFDPDGRSLVVDISDLDYKGMLNGATDDPVTLYSRRMAKFDEAIKTLLLGNEYTVVIRMKGKQLQLFSPQAPVQGTHLPIFKNEEDKKRHEKAVAWMKK